MFETGSPGGGGSSDIREGSGGNLPGRKLMVYGLVTIGVQFHLMLHWAISLKSSPDSKFSLSVLHNSNWIRSAKAAVSRRAQSSSPAEMTIG